MIDILNNLDTPIAWVEKDNPDMRTFREYFLEGYSLWFGVGKRTKEYVAKITDLDRTDNLSLNERYKELKDYLSNIKDLEEFKKAIKETNKLH